MNETEPNTWSARTLPWATFVAVALAVGIARSPVAIQTLEFDRVSIVHGEWWRVITGAWVHYNWRELIWNLAVIIPAGIWAERIVPVRSRVLFVLAPAVVGAVIYAAVPGLGRFAGLSGLAAGLVALLAIAQLRSTDQDRWFWRSVLGLLALKVAAEAVLASSLVSHFPDPAVQAKPLADLAGIASATLVLRTRRKRTPR